MADMPTEFWGGYIVGLTAISFACLVWLIYSIYFANGGDAEIADHVWDDNLREGQSPAPLWWFWLILALMVFSVVYLLLYPGLGTFRGALDWSQGHEIEMARGRYAATFGPERERLANSSVDDLMGDPRALARGAQIFNIQCSACHGVNAQGQADLFPSLADTEWQWGADQERIRLTLELGRMGIMPPWLAALQEDGVAELTDFVLAMAQGRANNPELAQSRTRYDQFCVACHGPTGDGNPLLGAPALNNDIWTYGGDYDSVYASIAAGRTGEMPAFGDRLDAMQLNLLTAWLVAGADTP